MEKELIQQIVHNLIMISWFMLPLIMCRLADIIFGAVIANKSIDMEFDSKILSKSLWQSGLFILGVAMLIVGIVSLPIIMQHYGIEIVDTEILEQVVNVVMVATLIIGTTVTYGKDAFIKLTKIVKK